MNQEEIIKEGTLKKYTNMVKGFQKRYFVLCKDMLLYYTSKDKCDSESPKKIHLRCASINPNRNDTVTINTGTHSFKLKFSSISEKVEWTNALRVTQAKCEFVNDTQTSHLVADEIQQNNIIDNQGNCNVSDEEKEFKIKAKKKISAKLPNLTKDSNDVSNMSKIKINPNILKQETKFIPLFEKSLADKLDRTLMKNISDVYQAFANMDQNLYQVRTKGEELKDPSLAEFSNEIEKHQQIIKNIMTSSFQQMKDFLKLYREQAINSSKIIDQELKIEGKENLQDLSNDQAASQSLNLNEENLEIFQKEKKNNGDSDSNDTIFYDAYDAMILDEIEREIKRESLSSSPNDDLVENEERITLPSLKPDVKFSLIKILKDAVGKDLTKFCVPVYFNEPISMLQKVAEMMNNERIIKEAANQTDPLKRLCYLAAFNVAMYGQTMNRISKPFNPMLGETFEMTGNGWKLLAEQVSHHPPISALYLSSNDFEIQMNTAMTTHFWGKSLEFKPKGVMHYTFHDNDDHYIVERPISACRNVIFGTMYIEHYGKMTIKNMRTGDECVLEFHKAGKGLFGSAKNVGLVEGVVKDADGEIHYNLRGRWNETISMSPNTAKNNQFDEKNSTLLWQAETPPDNWERIYHFSRFTLQLNKITNEMKQTLPLTDSRRRTDQRALENGDLTLANNEKHRLEERQRAMRKYREQNFIEWAPSYFEKYTDSLTGLEEYRYINNYWEDKKQQNWSHLPDLFGYD